MKLERTRRPPYGKSQIGRVKPRPGEADAQAIDVREDGQLAGREPKSYQGVPPVKKAPWEWYYIPVYFWAGGIAGGSWLAATAEDLAGGNDRGVVRAGRYLALAGVTGGTALLVLDLGRPERFLNMLRVFRARSAMNLGSWVLTGFGAFAGAAGLLQAAEDGLFGRRPRLARLSRGWLGRTLHLAGLPPALFAGGYTGVLLASTATPAWAKRKLLLPPLFMASATSTGLAATSIMVEATGGAERATRRRLGRAETLALVAELALTAADRAVAGTLPSARDEAAGIQLARGLAIGAGVVAPLALHLRGRAPPQRSRSRKPKRGLVAAGLTLAGGLALRLLTAHEGKRSADTPADTWAFAGNDERKRSTTPPALAERETRSAAEATHAT